MASATCYNCDRREGETVLVVEARPRRFGEPHPGGWFWLDEQPPERLRKRGQKGPLPPIWRDRLGAVVPNPRLEGARSRLLVVLYDTRGDYWDGELVCGECLAELTLDDRGRDAVFTRREPVRGKLEGQMSLMLVGGGDGGE